MESNRYIADQLDRITKHRYYETRTTAPHLLYWLSGEIDECNDADAVCISGHYQWEPGELAFGLGEYNVRGYRGAFGLAPADVVICPEAQPSEVAHWLRRYADHLEQRGIPAPSPTDQLLRDAMQRETHGAATQPAEAELPEHVDDLFATAQPAT